MSFLEKHGRFITSILLAVFLLSGCGGAEERKAKYMELAKAYYEEGNYAKARIEFNNVLQIDPKSPGPYYYLGKIAEKDEDWRKAFGSYLKAVDLDPDHVDTRIRLGYMYLFRGWGVEAVRACGCCAVERT